MHKGADEVYRLGAARRSRKAVELAGLARNSRMKGRK